MTSDSHEQAEDFAVKPEAEPEGWALRPPMLALIGLAAGYGVHLIIGTDTSHTPSVMQMTLLTALIVGTGLFGLTVERRHIPAALVFALVCTGARPGALTRQPLAHREESRPARRPGAGSDFDL